MILEVEEGQSGMRFKEDYFNLTKEAVSHSRDIC